MRLFPVTTKITDLMVVVLILLLAAGIQITSGCAVLTATPGWSPSRLTPRMAKLKEGRLFKKRACCQVRRCNGLANGVGGLRLCWFACS